jgi:ADP-ribose pyrophosphatase YjhB (NUDIX family)
MNRSDIRVKAMGVFRRGNEILASDVRENDGTLKGFRLPGGHVEFGEKGLDAFCREIQEELNTGVSDVQFLTMHESLFVYNGKPGHEVIFVYTARLNDATLYERDEILAHEDNGKPFVLKWRDINALPEGTDIFPSGIVAHLPRG